MKSQKVPRTYTKKASRKDQDGNPMAMGAGALGTTSRGTGASTRGKKRRLAAGEQDSRTIVASNPFDDEPSTGPPIHLLHHQVSFAQGLGQAPPLQPPPPPHHHQHLQHHQQHPHQHQHHHQHPHSHPHQQQMMLINHNPHHDFHSPQPMHMSSPGPPPGYAGPAGMMPPESPMLPGGVAPVYSPAPPPMAPRMSGPPHMMHQPPGPPMHQQLGTPPHMVCADQLGLQPPPPPPMHHQSPGIASMGTPSPRPPPMYAPPHFQPAGYALPEPGAIPVGVGPGQPQAQLGAASMVSPPPPPPPPQQVAGPSPNLQQQAHMVPPPPSQMGLQDQMAYQQQQPQAPPPPPGQPQMLVRCAQCGQPIYQNEPQIMCRAGCESTYHQRCSGLSELACELLLQEKAAEWVCQQCTNSRKFPAIRQISQEPDCRQSVW